MAIEAAVLPLLLSKALAAREPTRLAFAGNRRHEGFDVVAFRAFESPRIETRTFRLDDPQGHHCSAFWASRALDTVYEHCVSPLGRND